VAQEDGTGSATTTLEDVTTGKLFAKDKERFILFHAKTEKGEGVPPGIACADLVRETTMLDSDLPRSGGLNILLLATAALLLGGGVLLSYAVFRRRP
jgi:hypothetical protein